MSRRQSQKHKAPNNGPSTGDPAFSSCTSLPNRRESARTITNWTLRVLNKYLKGSADPMPRTADYPQIRVLR